MTLCNERITVKLNSYQFRECEETVEKQIHGSLLRP